MRYLICVTTYAASAKEIEKLKAELQKAKREAADEKAAAEQAATAISALKATSAKHEARVEETSRSSKTPVKSARSSSRKARSRLPNYPP